MFKLFKHGSTTDGIEMTVSSRTVLRVIGLLLAVGVVVMAIVTAKQSLIIVFSAFFLALALNAPVSFFARHLPAKLRGSRVAGAAVTFMIGVLFVGIFASLAVPPLVTQSRSLIDAAPSLVQQVRDPNSNVGKIVQKYKLQDQVDSLSGDLGSRLKSLSGSALHTLGKVGSSVVAVITTLVLAFMMLSEGPRILEFFNEIVPKARRKDVARVSQDMYRVVKGYVNGQVTLAAIASVAILPALFVFHVSYPFVLVFVIFICGLIPLVGHTIGAVIVTIVAAITSSLPHALFVLAWYITYQQLENYLVQPKIQANSTDMSPLLVFMSVIIGISFGGLFGGLFAIPVAGCIRIAVLEWLMNRDYIQRADTPVIDQTVADAQA